MKIYTEYHKEATDSVEIRLDNYLELKDVVRALKTFENKIYQFKAENRGKTDLGVTHIHFKDCGLIDENSKTDLVIYVDLDK